MTNQSEAEPRIELIPLSISMMEGLIAGDRNRAANGYDLTFLEPLLPVDIEEALPFILGRVSAHPADVPWWARLVVRLSDRAVIGSVGFAGPPDAGGVVTMGYSVHPTEEGKGYGTEAARMLIAWGFNQPQVQAIHATIPPWNSASLRIAQKCGMKKVGMAQDDEEGELEVWEIRRDLLDRPRR